MATVDRRVPPIISKLTYDRRLVYVQALITFFVIWAIFARWFGLQGTISDPELVYWATYELAVTGEWITHLGLTLYRTIISFAITVGLATFLGIVIGLSNTAERGLRFYVVIGMGMPPLLIVVFAAMWFGFGHMTPIIGAALSTFPFMADNLIEGVQDLNRELVQMSRSFGVSRRRVIKDVVVRSILPEWFAGIRYSFAICFKIVTLGEAIAGGNGIGFKIEEQLEFLDITPLLAWVVVFTLAFLVIEYGIFRPLERRLFSYRPELSTGTAA